MRILVTGASGLIGSALVSVLTASGHTVSRLVRSQPRPGQADIPWDPATRSIATPALEGFDAVVHLAGENIAQGRWTAEKKARLYHSRVDGTQVLCESLLQLVKPPKIFLSASAIGYYGSRGNRLLQEESAPGTDFIAHICRDWEAAAAPAAARGMRVACLRIGVVLSTAGGMLAKMLTPFRLGGGGKIGTGKQYISWIALDDVVGAIQHILATETLQGPINLVTPQAVTNSDFTITLGKVLGRPTIFSMPAFAARMLFGEMADALMLASTRAEPARLTDSGYTFRHPDLEDALRFLLGKPQQD